MSDAPGRPTGRPEIGTYVAVADPGLSEALASAFDVLIIDLEHGPLGLGQVPPMLMAIRASGAKAMVRVPDWSFHLAPLLDAGVDGLVAPTVESSDQAAAFAAGLLYPPRGTRGFGPRRTADYGRRSAIDEPAPICAVQIETKEGIEQAATIAAVDGLDLLIVGCSDLSLALGQPGQFDTPEIKNAIDVVGRAALANNVGFAVAAGAPAERMSAITALPVDLFLCGLDLRIYVDAADRAADRLRQATVGRDHPAHDRSR